MYKIIFEMVNDNGEWVKTSSLADSKKMVELKLKAISIRNDFRNPTVQEK